MKALVKSHAKKGIWLEDVPKPEVHGNEVLIEVHKTAICGTDVHIYDWNDWAQETIKTPMILGHEFSGVVAEVGEGVRGLQVGDVVSAEGHVVCNRCRNCLGGRKHLCPNTSGIGVNRDGAFAEYIVVPAENVFRPTQDVTTDLLACFDPFGNAVHTALSFDMLGEDVLITGAGPIGMMAAMVAVHAGARHVVITDVNDYRLSLVRKVVPEAIPLNVSDEKISQSFLEGLSIYEGFDIGLEMSGSPEAFNAMLGVMINGGKIAMLGLMPSGAGIDWNLVVFKGLLIKGIYGREIFETWYKGSMMVQGGLPLEKIITHHFHYTDYQKAFDVMSSGQSGKVILNWEVKSKSDYYEF